MGIFKKNKRKSVKDKVEYYTTNKRGEIVYEKDMINGETIEKQDLKSDNFDRKKKKRRKKSFITFKKIIILIILLGLAYFVMRLKYFDIKEITVKGNETLEPAVVVKESGIEVGDNVFFLNKKKIKDRMQENSLYKEIDISRKLPNGIEITIKERKGKVVLPYGEKFVLLDEQGVVIGLLKEKPKVTELENLNIKNMDKGEEITIKEEEEFKKALNVLVESEKADIFFQYINISKNKCILTVYGNLYVKGDYDDIMETLKNEKLKLIIADVFGKGISRGTIKVDSPKDLSFTPVFE